MDSKTYLNAILTAIALLLLVIALQRPAPELGSSAYAQDRNEQQRRYLSETSDQALIAQATEKVANANLEIARQIGEMGKAIGKVSSAVDRISMAPRAQ
ncbi:hypothetical protein JW916_10520 [Candidatus Sumerlaeota bacterium]|nr:hypothetical protein [Candidatus Sumerlaeota bacterium]